MCPSTFANSPAHRPNHTQGADAGEHEDRYDDNDYDCEECDDYEGEDNGDDDVFYLYFLTVTFICASIEPHTRPYNGSCNSPNSTAVIVLTQL